MAFQKGVSGNRRGKIPGTLNRKTVEHLNRAQSLIEKIEAHSKFVNMLDSLSEKEMAALYTNLLEYTQPRLARQEHVDSEGGALLINVVHSPAPVMLPLKPQAEQIEYTDIKSEKPF